ncbi:hypothetical protein EG68_01742 [Paragonimus skrjabini miyazakii]|uniref:Uncharacterized protein n=1 Tax=Paragonimus skrjabini miyazakii TaxID=59628 RepID=A0A8S9Z6P0_9TREM|nr:hypothetical protein EG68_01742 [Paragonimus skrjabini miyazakii]
MNSSILKDFVSWQSPMKTVSLLAGFEALIQEVSECCRAIIVTFTTSMALVVSETAKTDGPLKTYIKM